MSNKRIDWLDVSKFVAITTMVLGHIGVTSSMSDLIHIFHMPVFFIVSGMCFNEQKYYSFKSIFVSRCRSLLLPHFVWSIIMYLVWLIYIQFAPMGEYVAPLDFIVLLFTKDATSLYFGGFGVIQWFFTSLFFAEMYFWAFLRISSKLGKTDKSKYIILVALSLVLMMAGEVYSNFTTYNPLGMVSGFMGTVFLTAGYLFKKYLDKYGNEIFKNILVLVLTAGVLLVSWLFNSSANMRVIEYGNVALFIAGALAGSYLIFWASQVFVWLFRNNMSSKLYRGVVYIGQNTLTVLIFNRVVQYTFISLLYFGLTLITGEAFAVSVMGKSIFGIIGLVVEMFIFIPVIYLVNRFLPFTLGKSIKRKAGV